jgi:hypothetical protein
MKHLEKLLHKNKDLVIVFIISIFLSFPYIIDICSGYLRHYNFDIQEFLLWNYTSVNNLIPYKDIFYPYGLLSYFRNYSLVFASMFYLISPILFTILYFVFKNIFKERFILYTSFIIFYLFILNLVGLQTFARYGMFVLFSLMISYLFYLNKRIKE